MTYKNKMRSIYLLLGLFATTACQNNNQPTQKIETTATPVVATKSKNPIVDKFGSKQILVVKTANVDVIQGSLRVYEWDEKVEKWQPLTDDIAIVVGGKGLAWGAGLQDPSFNQPPLKKESDKKSPAGIFYLSTLFGYAPQKTLGSLKMPYFQADSSIFCVDDGRSKYYNRIVDADTLKKDWQSGWVKDNAG